MFSYKANAICMAGMTMPAGAGVDASHCWNRVRKPGQLINYVRFWPHRWTFAKNRTAHAQTHYRKSTQWPVSLVLASGGNHFARYFCDVLYVISIICCYHYCYLQFYLYLFNKLLCDTLKIPDGNYWKLTATNRLNALPLVTRILSDTVNL